MPAEGIAFAGHDALLSYEEILRLLKIAASLGIAKVRFTGGEPFTRKDFLHLLEKTIAIDGIAEVHITSNGVALAEQVKTLEDLGIAGINLSLDTLDPERFHAITRRDYFSRVMNSIESVLASSMPLKINSVIQVGFNTDEIVGLARLAENHSVTVRFIEQMPFNGSGEKVEAGWDGQRIFSELQKAWPAIKKVHFNSGTAELYKVPGFIGMLGIINAFSRQFCGNCDKIRITPTGTLKTCLYDNGVLDIKTMLRGLADDEALQRAILSCLQNRAVNGHEAQARSADRQKPSMATIGG
jgi:cyclic pyranopterin phosphate synthase